MKWPEHVALEDSLLAAGTLGASVSVGGLYGVLYGVLLLSVLLLVAGVLLGRRAPE